MIQLKQARAAYTSRPMTFYDPERVDDPSRHRRQAEESLSPEASPQKKIGRPDRRGADRDQLTYSKCRWTCEETGESLSSHNTPMTIPDDPQLLLHASPVTE
ncbi:hypothetical protein E4U30_003325 [Claviceps sp. LM220 group G6]|nr:hypothetical protein E4U30_003325 [Claviceps sp. LM220 group G6]